jgi:hypothetical protein
MAVVEYPVNALISKIKWSKIDEFFGSFARQRCRVHGRIVRRSGVA